MKLLHCVREVGLRMHLAVNTIDCYSRWIREFLIFHRDGQRWRHPRELDARHVEAFLTHLATIRRLAASTQNPMPKASGPRALGNHDNLYPRLT